MAQYIGLKRIAERMGYKAERSAVDLLRREGFPMFRRHVQGKLRWWIDDDLIRAWMLKRSELERQRIDAAGLYQYHRNRGVAPAAALAAQAPVSASQSPSTVAAHEPRNPTSDNN